MQNRARFVSVLLSTVLAGALASGCCAIGLGDCSFDLDIHAREDVSQQLKSLFVIVAKKNDVREQLEDPNRYSELLKVDQLTDKYSFFAQYQLQLKHPDPAKQPTLEWSLVEQRRQHQFVEAEIDGQSIDVSVEKKLVDSGSGTEYCVIVIANYASGGLELERVEQDTLAARIDQLLEVEMATLTLVPS